MINKPILKIPPSLEIDPGELEIQDPPEPISWLLEGNDTFWLYQSKNLSDIAYLSSQKTHNWYGVHYIDSEKKNKLPAKIILGRYGGCYIIYKNKSPFMQVNYLRSSEVPKEPGYKYLFKDIDGKYWKNDDFLLRFGPFYYIILGRTYEFCLTNDRHRQLIKFNFVNKEKDSFQYNQMLQFLTDNDIRLLLEHGFSKKDLNIEKRKFSKL